MFCSCFLSPSNDFSFFLSFYPLILTDEGEEDDEEQAEVTVSHLTLSLRSKTE